MRKRFFYSGLAKQLLVLCTLMVLYTNALAQCNCTFTIASGAGGVTFDGAAKGVKPGDVICLQAGSRERIIFQNIRGSADKPVIIKNCGGRVLLGGPNANSAISFSSSRYFRVTGSGDASQQYGIKITETKPSTSGIVVSGLSSDVEIDHVEITKTGFAGIIAKTDPTSNCSDKSMVRPNFTMYNVKLHDNYIHDVGGEGLYVGNSYYTGTTVYCGSTQYPHEMRGVKIYNNVLDRCGWESIQVGSAVKDVEVHNNKIYNYGTADKNSQNGGIQFGLGTSGRLYNNFIKGNPNGTGGQAIVIQGIGNTYVYNNVIVNSPDESITINTKPTPLATDIVNKGWLGGTYVINNTIVNPGKAAIADFVNQAPGNVFYNNLVVVGKDPNWNKMKTYYDWKASNNVVVKSVSEARFVNPNADDYSLQSNSPAVNAGRDVASFGVTKDYQGKARPSGTTWDAGAYEMSSAQNPSQGNQPPVVSSPIADQNAYAGASFTYSFPSNTFTDPNAGNVLTYTATMSNGSALPGWLKFNASTRTFTGTPTAGSTGTLDIRVTASDGKGGSVSDVFALNIRAKSSSVAFYRAINLNGGAIVVDGKNWEASASAKGFSYTDGRTFANQSVRLQPATDANRSTMIRSSIWGGNVGLALSGVPKGSYQVYLYVWEDNYTEVFSIWLEGKVVQANYNSGTTGKWNKLGPFTTNVSDGTINVVAKGGAANLSGLEIWSAPAQGSGARMATNEPEVVFEEEQDSSHVAFTAFPNPFSQSMNISFTTEQSAPTKLVMFDSKGTSIRTLYQEDLEAGKTEHLKIESEGMTNGVYILQLVNGTFIRRLRVVLLR